MTIPETTRLTPLPMIAINKNDERLDRVVQDMLDDQWIDDFIKHLNCTIEDIDRKD
jgi:hypothetical protein